MNLLTPEYFWLLLLLAPFFIKRGFAELRFSTYGYILTFVFIIIALSRPVIEQEPIKREQILSDVIIAVDLSYSMQATDINPTRLEKAKEVLKTILDNEKNSRFGVIGFTTNAIVLSPLTQDSELLLHLFNSLDESLIMTKGSSVMPALKLAKKMSSSKSPTLVILSDGADSSSYIKEVKYAKENSLSVNILMLATTLGSTISQQNGELLKDENGDIVVSRENEAIEVIANATGGVYTKDLDDLLSALDSQKNEDEKTQTTVVVNLEFFYYFVLLAIIIFLVSVTTLKRFIISFLLLFGISLEASVFEYVDEKIAKGAYEAKEYKKAARHYGNIEKDKAYYNLGNSYYKTGEYEKALVNFERVKSSDAEFKSNVFYNMANTFVRLKEFKKAREAYLKSLTLIYTKEADENLEYIKDVQKQKNMTTGQQKTKKKSSFAKQENSSAKKKDGGSSNMQVSASASSGAGEMGKKTKSDSMFNLNGSKAI